MVGEMFEASRRLTGLPGGAEIDRPRPLRCTYIRFGRAVAPALRVLPRGDIIIDQSTSIAETTTTTTNSWTRLGDNLLVLSLSCCAGLEDCGATNPPRKQTASASSTLLKRAAVPAYNHIVPKLQYDLFTSIKPLQLQTIFRIASCPPD